MPFPYISKPTPIQLKTLSFMGGGVAVLALPVLTWQYYAHKQRVEHYEEVETRVRIPNIRDTDDYMIEEKCQAGDVVLFDRRCEKCATSPWAAMACIVSKGILCDDKNSLRSVADGQFDHMGIIVPGFINKRSDEFDPSNLLLLEATPQGIVARPLKSRLEHSSSKSVMLLQLNSPGERRNLDEYDKDQLQEQKRKKNKEAQGVSSIKVLGQDPTASYVTTADILELQLPSVQRTRKFLETELTKFRDKWLKLSDDHNYSRMHSTATIGGALSYFFGISPTVTNSPVSPSANLVLRALQQSAAAQNINEKDNLGVKVEDFLRDYRFNEKDSVRLRPGWKFLAPIALRENSRS